MGKVDDHSATNKCFFMDHTRISSKSKTGTIAWSSLVERDEGLYQPKWEAVVFTK